jgi:anti-sigma B factor antagonist
VPEDAGKPAVVVAPAELDIATAPILTRDIAAAFDAGATAVVADLSGTTFCDSSGLRALVNAAKRAHAQGLQFTLRRPSPMFRRMAAVLGASALLGLPPS